MPSVKQMISRPAGALPQNFMVRLSGVLGGGLVLVLFISLNFCGPPSDDEQTPAETDPEQIEPAAPVADQLENLTDEEKRLAARQQRQDQEPNSRRQDLPPITDPETGEALDPDIVELEHALRLEEIERRRRSLRAEPVAQTFRRDEGGGGRDREDEAAGGDRLDSLFSRLAEAQEGAGERNAAMLRALQGPAAAPAATVPGGAYRPVPGELDIPLPDSDDLPPYADPARLDAPDDPDGFERVYEGSIVEAVLVTQLSGDFPSPVIAQVSVPFYSADRQRVLIPRGSRFIGTAQAVQDRDQTRLAVGFHRLVLPDGRWAALRFQGLSQAGEGALKDQVDRHYLSMFLAAGGVGVLSGLTLQGSSPYGGGEERFRAGAGQGLGQAATQILQRFLNRLPTITIRAGHRLRVWFTEDALIPRPTHHP